ncbi:hypothetical protein LA080_000702 [Diaporthe eres]|nr:hypothetical protein LA080_000702 [Diaporthe eres]
MKLAAQNSDFLFWGEADRIGSRNHLEKSTGDVMDTHDDVLPNPWAQHAAEPYKFGASHSAAPAAPSGRIYGGELPDQMGYPSTELALEHANRPQSGGETTGQAELGVVRRGRPISTAKRGRKTGGVQADGGFAGNTEQEPKPEKSAQQLAGPMKTTQESKLVENMEQVQGMVEKLSLLLQVGQHAIGEHEAGVMLTARSIRMSAQQSMVESVERAIENTGVRKVQTSTIESGHSSPYSIVYIQDYDRGGEQGSRNASGGADGNQKSLDDCVWIDGEWAPADAELAAYIDTEILESSEENFEQSRARSDDARGELLPRKALTEILIKGTIQSLLQQKPEISHISSTDITGEKKRIKIFAILLLIKKTEYIGHIIQQVVSDDDLPLEQARSKACLRAEDRHVKDFLSYQYEVAVPVWDPSAHKIQEQQYDRPQKLPFLSKLPIASGGQGVVVLKVNIHCDDYETKTESRSSRRKAISEMSWKHSLWDEDECCQRRVPHFDSQVSAQANLISSAFSDGWGRQSLSDPVGSKHDFGQIEDICGRKDWAWQICDCLYSNDHHNIFADESMPSRSSGPWHTRPPAAATGSIPLSDDDMLQNVPKPNLHDSHRKSP